MVTFLLAISLVINFFLIIALIFYINDNRDYKSKFRKECLRRNELEIRLRELSQENKIDDKINLPLNKETLFWG